MNSEYRYIQKTLLGAEDCLLGAGSVTQNRGGNSYSINKLNATLIPYSGDSETGDFVSIKSQIDSVSVANDAYTAEALTPVGTVYVTSLGELQVDTIASVLTEAAQPNVTSLGTLTGLTMAGNIIIGDGNTIGQVAGPLLTFDDTNNYLEITGCNVAIGHTDPQYSLDTRVAANTFANALLGDVDISGQWVGQIFGNDGATDYKKGAIIYEGLDGSARGRFHLCLESSASAANVGLADAKLTVNYLGNVGIGTDAPATSAILELSNTAGALLLTRLTTTQKNALTAVNGMLVYDSTLNKFQGYENGSWTSLI